MTKQIEIDIDVYRVIENGRISFDETQNTILRRLLGIENTPQTNPPLQPNEVLLYSNNDKTPPSEYPKNNEVASLYNNKIQPLESSKTSDKIIAFQTKTLANRLAGIFSSGSSDWHYGGVSLPEGTQLQKWSRKQKIEAVIYNGSIYLNGEYHQSPSSAAMSVNGGVNVNGWDFWDYFDQKTKEWKRLDELRKKK
jgi:hypothetical protein